jgi:hypothetical protein
MRRALVGSDRLGSGCLVLRADTRENPGGKNGVMTVTRRSGHGSGRGSGHARVGARGSEDKKYAGSFTGAWRRVRRFPALIFLVEIRLDETKPWMSLKR